MYTYIYFFFTGDMINLVSDGLIRDFGFTPLATLYYWCVLGKDTDESQSKSDYPITRRQNCRLVQIEANCIRNLKCIQNEK